MNPHFLQLCEETFLREKQINYTILTWRPIKIKPHCETALKNMIDALDAVKEFRIEK